MFHHSDPSKLRAIKVLGLIPLLLLMIFPSPQATLAASPQVLPAVGLIIEGQLDDQGYNQMAYAGFTQAITEGAIVGTLYTPTTVPGFTYESALQQCVTDGNSLCITVGFVAATATMAAANANPSVHFAIVDMSWEDPEYPPNLRGMYFAVDEVAYLAGTLAGLMTTSNKIGTIGGWDIPPVNNFLLPFEYGARWADHEVIVFREYANNFTDEALGASIAQDQINNGADVIFGVGGPMGNGAIKKAAELGKYVIGVDVDAYFTVFDSGAVTGAEYLLTSVMKMVDKAVLNTIKDHAGGIFTSGTKLYSLANDGVGFAPYHESLSSIPPAVLTQIQNVGDDIAEGNIDVWQPYWSDVIYLPTISR